MTRANWLIAFTALFAGAAYGQAIEEPGDIPVERFAQLPMMRGAALSPDGGRLAYIRAIEGRAHIVIQDLTGENNPVVIPPSEFNNIDWLRWANNDRLVFLLSTSGSRDRVETTESRLAAIDKDGTNLASLVLPEGRSTIGSRIGRDLPVPQLQGDVIHWLPDEPDYILLSVDGDLNGADEVRKIDIRDGSYRHLRREAAGIQRWMTDQAGNVRFGWGYRRSTFRALLQTEGGKWRSADDASWWSEGFGPLAFSADPSVAYMTGRTDSGYQAVYKVNVFSSEVLETVFERDGIDAQGIVRDPLTDLPVGVSYTGDYTRVEYFEPKLRALQRGIDKALPGSANYIESMTADRQQVLIYSESSTDPGTYFYLNRANSNLSLLTEVMPGLPADLLSNTEPVYYDARDGLTIPAYITFPVGTPRENLPFVVLPHGGPESRDDAGFDYLSQFIVSRGYGVLQPNFRGSTGYGQAFQNAGRSEWGGKMQEDVVDGTQWLIDEGFADPENICIVGWSYGGYAAAMGAVQTPDLYQCAASINGVLNLPRLIADDKKYIGGSVWTRHVGLGDEKSKVVSPYHQAERIEIPLLIIQAEDDARVHEDQGKGMASRLRRLKKPYEYIEIEAGGHSMTNEPGRATILSALEAFLAENLE